MNSPKYKCDARTTTFLKLWFYYGVSLIEKTGWNDIEWKEVEVRVFKLQKRIYRASQSGDVAKVHKLHPPLSPHEMGGCKGGGALNS